MQPVPRKRAFGLIRPLFLGALLLVGGPWARGGDATFSNDGKRIYALAEQDDLDAIREIDLAASTVRLIPLPALKDQSLRGISRSAGEQILFVTNTALWAFDPKTAKPRKLRDAPKGKEFWRIAYDPKERANFLTTNDEENPLLIFPAPSEPYKPVFLRRHPYVSCLTFSASGEIFYAGRGDLWHGEILNDPDARGWTVTGYRYAPLAALETANTTPAETGIKDIAVSRDAIYVQLARLGGSGYGWLAELKRPQMKNGEEGIDLAFYPEERLPVYKAALDSLKILRENPGWTNLCASPDETKIYYFEKGTHWLITDGKFEQLTLKEK